MQPWCLYSGGITLGNHESTVEAAVFNKERTQSRDFSIDIAFNAGFTELSQREKCIAQEISSFGNVLSMEIASRNESIFGKPILYKVNERVICWAVHLVFHYFYATIETTSHSRQSLRTV